MSNARESTDALTGLRFVAALMVFVSHFPVPHVGNVGAVFMASGYAGSDGVLRPFRLHPDLEPGVFNTFGSYAVFFIMVTAVGLMVHFSLSSPSENPSAD